MTAGELIPLNQITLNADEKAMAALEVVKLNQLVILDNDGEDTMTPKPSDAIDKESLDLTVPCLITATDQAIEEELLLRPVSVDLAVPCLITTTDKNAGEELSLKPISSGFRAQKATTSVREKVAKVEIYSNYILSPLKRNYKTYFHTLMTFFKALKSWLTCKASNKAPTGWLQTRQAILTRLEERTKSPFGEEAPKEEVPYENATMPK